MKSYFNNEEYIYVKSFLRTNPSETLIRTEEYIKKYPNDYFAGVFYSKVLKVLGGFSEALYVLDNIEERYTSNKKLFNDFAKYNIIEEKVLYNKLRCLSYLEDFDKVEKLLNENRKYLINPKFGYFSNLVKYSKMENINFNASYRLEQLFNYSDEEFLSHISKHMYSRVEDYDVISTFNEDFPFDKVFYEVKKKILFSKAYYFGTYEDVYIFKYDKCGVTSGKVSDYFLVITFHNTNKYISMYPCNSSSNFNYVDLNYLKIPSTSNVKRLSQIDKFNMRYKK